MRLLDALRSAAERLEQAGIDDPLADAEIIVFHASGSDRLAAYMKNPEIDGRTRSRITRLIGRRLTGEPVQYVVGQVDFHGLRILVGRGVLIPRPETELLVQEAVERLRQVEQPPGDLGILDLCTGTGCIAISLAREFPHAAIIGTDTSNAALKYARKNAGLNNIGNVSFRCGSLFKPLKGKTFDLIISNPPYIRAGEIATLQKEVRDWEPREALDGGEDGLDYYRAILSEAGDYLKEGGLVMFELGYDQADEVRTIAEQNSFRDIVIRKDYAGIERIFSAHRKEPKLHGSLSS